MKKLSLITLTLLALTGCKVEIEKTISLNKLLNEPLSVEAAQLSVEVAGCNDYKDSRHPSQALLEAQQKIPFIFSNAQFKECYRHQFNSYAVFEIPVGVGVMDVTRKDINLPDITLLSFKDDKGFMPLSIYVKKELKQRLNQIKKTDILANSMDFSVVFKLHNDLTETRKFRLISSYVNGTPYPDGVNITFQANSKKDFSVKLSNVAVDQLLKTDGDGIVNLLKEN